MMPSAPTEDKNRVEIDSQLYIPRLLYLRMTRRELLKVVCIISLFFNALLLALGFIFMDCVYNTRVYINSGDQFWDYLKVHNSQNNDFQKYLAFASIFTILASFMILTNNLVIIYHVHFGGLRGRLALTRWVNKICQILILALSVLLIATFSSLITLFPIYIGISAIAELTSIFIFVMVGKVTRKELDYMLPYKLMLIHKEEYYQEYITKKRAIINTNNIEYLNNELEKRKTYDNNDRIFIKNN